MKMNNATLPDGSMWKYMKDAGHEGGRGIGRHRVLLSHGRLLRRQRQALGRACDPGSCHRASGIVAERCPVDRPVDDTDKAGAAHDIAECDRYEIVDDPGDCDERRVEQRAPKPMPPPATMASMKEAKGRRLASLTPTFSTASLISAGR